MARNSGKVKADATQLTDEQKAQREAEAAKRKAEAKIERLVYTGERLTSSDKRVHSWSIIQEDGTLGGAHWYGPKNIVTHASIGSIYQVYSTPEGSTYTSGDLAPSYQGRWQSNDQIMVWQAEDRATGIVLAARKREKDADVNEALQALVPLRQMYQRTNFEGQRALETTLLEFLRRPPTEDELRRELRRRYGRD